MIAYLRDIVEALQIYEKKHTEEQWFDLLDPSSAKLSENVEDHDPF